MKRGSCARHEAAQAARLAWERADCCHACDHLTVDGLEPAEVGKAGAALSLCQGVAPVWCDPTRPGRALTVLKPAQARKVFGRDGPVVAFPLLYIARSAQILC